MLYDININPPILSVSTIMFMTCIIALLTIYINIDYQKLQKFKNRTEQILILISISIKVLILAFLFLNMVILYTKL